MRGPQLFGDGTTGAALQAHGSLAGSKPVGQSGNPSLRVAPMWEYSKPLVTIPVMSGPAG